MKKWYFIILLCVAASSSPAQTTAEWLQQKKTRIRYLLQQIASLQIYVSDLKKGYHTVRNGLDIITDIKHGDFNLHNDYFNSLFSVSRAVKGYDKVKGIADLQTQIIEVTKATKKLLASPFLFPSEQSHVRATISSLLQQCADDMDKLYTFTTTGEAQMTEERRLAVINALYQSAKDKYSFAVHLKESTQQLVMSRSHDEGDDSSMYSLYGLK